MSCSRLFRAIALAIASIALFSLGYALWRFMGGERRLTLLVFESLLICSAVGFYRMQLRDSGWIAGGCAPGASNVPLINVLFFLSFGMGVASAVIMSWRWPYSGWDGWAIWTLRARFLFLGGAQWRETFTNLNAWCHPDYPLMVSGLIAGVWTLLQRPWQAVPILVAFLSITSVVLALAAAVGERRGRLQGALAGLVLSGSAFFWQTGQGMSADVPLGLFILLSVVCAESAFATPAFSLWPLLAGFFAGCAAWTKNEGAVFLLGLTLMMLREVWRDRVWRRGSLYFIGAMPWVWVWLVFKFTLAPRTDLLPVGQEARAIVFLQDLGRLGYIVKAWGLYIERFSDHAVLFLVVYAGLVGGFLRGGQRKRLDVALIGAMGIGYTLAYWITPRDLAWHMSTSANRLLLQIWPLSLYAFFTRVKSPEIFSRSSVPGSTLPAAG